VDYQVDLRDIKFQLFEWLGLADMLEAEKFADWDAENVEMVLDEALKIAQEQMGPCNEDGDRIGAQYDDGKVTLPESFKPVYQTICEGGWIGLLASPEFGGMGLPDTVGTAVNEFFNGSNVSLSLTLMLTRGAGAMIEGFGTDEQKALFVEKLFSGEWTGTMCLTEAQAGSDVGASTTKAVKQDDGTYSISGEKIFITGGDHDLVDNIIHLVLARTPDAPAGTKGLSLFIIPKIRVNADGSLGEPNDVFTNNIEEKMGIHGSPTCTLVFGQNDGCQGFLLGEELQGMKLMFHLMNAARIDVGLQGLAAAGAAHQQALGYSRERLQSKHWKEFKNPEAPQVAIVEHPDVRRMLLTSKAYTEAMRALLYQTSYYLDMSHLTEGEESERYNSYVEMLTPICKAWCSEWGVQVTHLCLQVHGGYGYTSEYPAEQFMRDAEIACIYEGTNGIQALDFVARKLPMNNGQTIVHLQEAAQRPRDDGAGLDARRRPQTDRDHLQGDHQAAGCHPAHPPQRATSPRYGRHGPRRPLPDESGCPRQAEAGRDPRREGPRNRRQEGLQGVPRGQRRGGLLPQQGADCDPLRLPRSPDRGRQRCGHPLGRDHVIAFLSPPSWQPPHEAGAFFR
jgi:alkylation response protein AidB-like acyl-CoA dehydrogenase